MPQTLPELIRFLIDRTGLHQGAETEGSPEAFSRIENLKELPMPLTMRRCAEKHWPSSSTTPPWLRIQISTIPTPALR